MRHCQEVPNASSKHVVELPVPCSSKPHWKGFVDQFSAENTVFFRVAIGCLEIRCSIQLSYGRKGLSDNNLRMIGLQPSDKTSATLSVIRHQLYQRALIAAISSWSLK